MVDEARLRFFALKAPRSIKRIDLQSIRVCEINMTNETSISIVRRRKYEFGKQDGNKVYHDNFLIRLFPQTPNLGSSCNCSLPNWEQTWSVS